jgi:hypothetical protein
MVILHAGAVWRLVDLASARPRGSPQHDWCVLCGSAPGLSRGSPWRGRGDATPCPTWPSRAVRVAGHLGDLPARRGHGSIDWEDPRETTQS